MKFSIKQDVLAETLQVVGTAIGKNSTLPILECFLFSLKGKDLSVAATDLDISVRKTVQVINPTGEGAIALPGGILASAVKSLPKEDLLFEINLKTQNVKIKTSAGEYSLVGEVGEDFPNIPELDTANSIQLVGVNLIEALEATLFATSNDELRPAFTGVNFILNGNMTCVATDAKKLVKYQLYNVSSKTKQEFLLPRKGGHALKSALNKTESVYMSSDENNAFFKTGNTEVICRLVAARYPDYEAVIPKNNPYTLSVNRKDLLSVLRRVQLFSNKATYQVVLSIAESQLTISAEDLDFANKAEESLPCTFDGSNLEIAFNARFTEQVLKSFNSTEVVFELAAPNVAAIVRPAIENDGVNNQCLLMPIMLSH